MISCLSVLGVFLSRLWSSLVHKLNVGNPLDFDNIVCWGSDFVEEWREAHGDDAHQSGSGSIAIADFKSVWKPPEDGIFKINTDAALDSLTRSMGFGIIIWDNSGAVKASAAQKVSALVSPLVAEAMAVGRGIKIALKEGLVPFQIESDSLQVVNMVLKREPSYADVGTIIDKILLSLSGKPRLCKAMLGCGGDGEEVEK
ncbi:hypothetical protein LWI29_018896 [Acer saccharum]|uniref:RNase H type-1 domain-containing protein n=1 Tax=Acer saccharum TaxID=4024 RepID=A0AA39V9K8_ACESA|nr:hypothetical protein LWI29_018896 [Acer saccharum]